jgi:hypothetical protein
MLKGIAINFQNRADNLLFGLVIHLHPASPQPLPIQVVPNPAHVLFQVFSVGNRIACPTAAIPFKSGPEAVLVEVALNVGL